MFKINHLNSFVIVAKYGNFTAASVDLGMTSVGVSKHITQLELALSQPLFNRSTRKLRLTSFGHEFLEFAQGIVTQSTDAVDWAESYNKEPTGLLRVVFQNTNILELMILPWLKEFKTKYPKIKLEFQVANKLIEFDKNHADIYWAISKYLGRDYPGIKSIPIFESKYGVFASPDYLKEYGEPLKPDDLIHHKVVALSTNDPTNVIMVNKGPNVIDGISCVLMDQAICSDTHIADLSAQGFGLMNGARESLDVQKHLKSGKLVPVLEDYWIKKAKLFVYYHQVKHNQSKVRTFIDFFMDKKKHWKHNDKN